MNPPDATHFPDDLVTNGFAKVMLAGFALLVLASVIRVRPGSRANMALALMATSLLLAFTGLAGWLLDIHKWGYILAFLPGALIARHAIYLRLVRRSGFDPSVEPLQGLGDKQLKRLEPLFLRVRK